MVIQRDYHEALDVIDNTLKTIFETIYQRYQKELEVVKTLSTRGFGLARGNAAADVQRGHRASERFRLGG